MKTVALATVAALLASPLSAQATELGEAAVCEVPFLESAQQEPAPAPQQEPPAPEKPPEAPQEPAPPKEPPPSRPSLKPRDLWRDIKVEAKRYLADGYAIATAPIHWDSADWKRFGGVLVLAGGLMLADRTIDRELQENRSRFTDEISEATTDFGGSWSQNVGFAFLGAGYLFRSWELRETGREVLEASFYTHLLSKYVLKPAFGRERPFESDGKTRFHLGSSTYDSFPSGHATQAFSLASVIAYRSKGWVVPALAYAGAVVVAFDRVNDRVHFASDVLAGAALGTAVGRFIVSRHKHAQGEKAPPDVQVVPIPGGVAARWLF